MKSASSPSQPRRRRAEPCQGRASNLNHNNLKELSKMSAIIRHAKSAWLTFDQIDFPDHARPTNARDVVALVSSIRTIGLQFPLTVIERDGRYLLIAGRHWLEALRVIGEERVPVRVADFDDIEAREDVGAAAPVRAGAGNGGASCLMHPPSRCCGISPACAGGMQAADGDSVACQTAVGNIRASTRFPLDAIGPQAASRVSPRVNRTVTAIAATAAASRRTSRVANANSEFLS
jgi:hypothetical protein